MRSQIQPKARLISRRQLAVRRKWIPPNYVLKPQRLGQGTTTRWIEAEYTASTDSGTINLTTLLNFSSEFSIMATHYRWFKLLKICICVYPDGSNTRLRFNNRWTDDTGNANIQYNDSTKIVQTHAMVNKFVKWMPPNANLFLNRNSGNNVTNLRVWSICDDILSDGNYTLPGIILWTKDGTGNPKFRVSMEFTFRGGDIPDSTKIEKLLNIVRGIEVKNKNLKTPTYSETKPDGFNETKEIEQIAKSSIS